MPKIDAEQQERETILVIGGSGFIGTRFVRRLIQGGKDVKIFDRRPSDSFPEICCEGDVRDARAVRRACRGVKAIVNLAAEHRDDVRPKSLYDEVNVVGARNVCSAATMENVKTLVFTSSVAVYAFSAHEVNEDTPVRPINDYGRTKYEAEQVFANWQRDSPIRCTVLVRPCVVFGEKNRGNVYNLIDQIARGRFIMVGSGKHKKSMAYVENVAAFLEHSLALEPGLHVYNYADKPDIDVASLVSRIRLHLGMKKTSRFTLPMPMALLAGSLADCVALVCRKTLPISAIRVRKFCANTQVSNARAIDGGFVPVVSLESGLEQTVRTEFGDRGANDRG